MTGKTPQGYIRHARRQLSMAQRNLVAALEVLALKSYPENHSAGLQEAIRDNDAAIQYLADLAHNFDFIPPPLAPPARGPIPSHRN